MASKQHDDLVRVIKLWVESNEPSSLFDNLYDIPGNWDKPFPILSKTKTVIKRIPDYYGTSKDMKNCYIGEAKTDFHGQSIQDFRAEAQLKAYFEFLINCKFTTSMFLLAVPGSDLIIAKHIVGQSKKETGYTGPIKYFTKDGIED